MTDAPREMAEPFSSEEGRAKLRDENGRALRLYLIDGRPVTDREGRPLLNIVGNPLISVVKKDGKTFYCDTKGSFLTDMHGRTDFKEGYSPTDCPPEPEQTRRCGCQVFALDGHPLTDTDGCPLYSSQGKPLVVFNPKGHPVTDLEGRDITDSLGVILNQNERPYLSEEKIPFRIFNEKGRPLTDENGFPFTNILGYPLVIHNSHRNPIMTLKGYPVKDAEGKNHWEDGFDLTKIPRYNIIHKAIICKNKEHGIAFDEYTFPLTDMYGFPLFDLEGTPLVRRKKGKWVDQANATATVIHKSLYDKDALKHLRNSRGKPVRLYDRRGYPLTDQDGTPLICSYGLILIKFNEYGEPVSDFTNFPPLDAAGNPYGSANFKPCREFQDNPTKDVVLKVKKRGFQYYDVCGMPVTSSEGIPLINSNQTLLAKFDSNFIPFQDNYGRDVYDILGLPVNSSLDKPLLAPNGTPIRLYNKLRRPLTDKYGNVLRTIANEPLLKRNAIGRIASDSKGEICYDADGTPMNLMGKFHPVKFPLHEILGRSLHWVDGSPVLLYDMSGEPYTDSRGCILLNSNGKPLIAYSQTGLIREINGGMIFDKDGYTNLKVVGRATKDKIAIYDEYDRPLIGHSGFILRLRTGQEIVEMDKYQYPIGTFDGRPVYDCKGNPLFTPLADMFLIPEFKNVTVLEGRIQLFDCEERPLLDINGLLLYTSKGIPLIQFRKNGKPRCDALGRPIFDMTGNPVCNPGGVWRDRNSTPFRLYDRKSMPVTDPRGKELQDIRGRSLISVDEFGHPKFDSNGEELCDANGHKFSAAGFLGTSVPPHGRTSSLIDRNGVPLKLFDMTGRPLTDECGKPLETSKGKPLLDTTRGVGNITDLAGASVFDQRQLPLGCTAFKPIYSMEGKPIILYNKDGNPLMTCEGIAIKRWDESPLLVFDQFGRPIGTENSELYDVYGNLVGTSDCILTGAPGRFISMMIEGRRVRLFDTAGRPLTDDKGNLLIRSDGEPVKPCSWGDNSG